LPLVTRTEAPGLLAAELAVEVGRTVVVEHSLGVDTIALVAMLGALALPKQTFVLLHTARLDHDPSAFIRRPGDS
jgi:predicted esterase